MPARPYPRVRTCVRRHAIVPLAVILAIALPGSLVHLDDHDVERSSLCASARPATGLLPFVRPLTGRPAIGDGPCSAPAVLGEGPFSFVPPGVDRAADHVGPPTATAQLCWYGPFESRPPPDL